MGITFTAQQRLDITRRQLNIVQENAAYASTQSALNAQQTSLLNVDSANEAFYTPQEMQAALYEQEGRDINGTIPAIYTDGTINPYVAGDLSTSAAFPGSAGALFFPGGSYAGLIPDQVPAVNGFLNPTGTDAQYELNIMSNSIINMGITQTINFLLNGISGNGAATSTTGTLPGGPQTGYVLSIHATMMVNFNVNDYIYVSDGTHSGVYQITNVAGTSLTINSIFPSAAGCATDASVNNHVVGFTEFERENLTSVDYQEILTNETNNISTLVTAWKAKISGQVAQLSAQQESRSPQTTQNAAALSADNSAISTLNSWIALSNTGSSGKYASSSLSILTNLIPVRQSFASTRIIQITTALGSVTVTGDTYSGVVGSPYYERYKWLNNRINIASGSARRYFAANQGIGFLSTLSNNNTAIQGDYNAYFLTKRITFIDATPIIQITDITGLSAGDSVTVVSETQPEITRGIVSIIGTTQLQLDKPIPNTYLANATAIARLFKTLQ